MVKAPRPIPPAVRATQARASDPASSAFVSANAGSGKTHVLVQRVIRLLLDGVSPEKILCITFTKAAAANMAERVFSTLGHWVTLDDDALNAAIREARGEIIIRMDAHSMYAPDYIRHCVEVLNETNAENVGGPALTRAATPAPGRNARNLRTAF